jgi:hypothetical protein
MLEEIRTELNEYSTALMQGTDKGVYDNSDIVRKINISQRFIWNLLFARFPELFLTSTTVTGSSGVYTIPSAIFRLSHIIDGDGNKISNISVKTKTMTNTTGSDFLYYRQGNTIVRDSGASGTLTFWYYYEPKELTQGCSVGGTATTITLDTNAKKIADYYNNIVIENITDGWSDTITDYATTRIATIATRAALGKYYGTVSELPEAFHHLIVKKAIIALKNQVVSPQRAEVPEIGDFREDLIETLRAFTGSYHGDIPMDELFYDFRAYV